MIQKLNLIFCLLLMAMPSFQIAKARSNDPQKSKQVLIVLAHPFPESFNHSVGNIVKERLAQKGYEVKIRDLYQLGFNPVLGLEEWKNYESADAERSPDVLAEQEAITWADHLVFIYPTWWWSPPAILKGYLDRVFTPNFAFSTDGAGKLTGKTVSVIQTTGSDENFIKTEGMDEAVKTLFSVGIFGFCGLEIAHHEFLMGISGKSYEELKQVLQEVDVMVDTWF